MRSETGGHHPARRAQRRVRDGAERSRAADLGARLAEGLPSEVQGNQAVRDAYLGEPIEPEADYLCSEFWNLMFSGLVTAATHWIMASGLGACVTDNGHLHLRARCGRAPPPPTCTTN